MLMDIANNFGYLFKMVLSAQKVTAESKMAKGWDSFLRKNRSTDSHNENISSAFVIKYVLVNVCKIVFLNELYPTHA